VLKFVAFQAVGIPFLIVAGTLMEGLESIPAGLTLTLRPGILLGLSFIFLLAVFPFHGWIPGLTEDYDPFSVGFVLVLLPGFIGVLGLQLIDRYAFLRNAEAFFTLVRTVGILSVGAGSALVIVQRHAGRILGYSALIETGMMLLAIGAGAGASARLYFPLFAARSGAVLLWSAGLSGMQSRGIPSRLSEMTAALRSYPFACAAVLVGAFSTAGFPLFAGFPARFRLAAALAEIEPTAVFSVWLAMAAMSAATVRMFAAMARTPIPVPDTEEEPAGPVMPVKVPTPPPLRLLFVTGCLLLLLLGLLPGWIPWLAERMSLAFEHLVR
jgi:formate hydrogenlyase subunit 3/multisubunit Na+/H+ antiporter MnhD subunit